MNKKGSITFNVIIVFVVLMAGEKSHHFQGKKRKMYVSLKEIYFLNSFMNKRFRVNTKMIYSLLKNKHWKRKSTNR